MVVRKTSLETYKTIVNSGLLSDRRLQVYDILFKCGPMTGSQVSAKMRELYGQSGYSENVRNRITELVRSGCVEELCETTCPITRRKVLLFDVTDKLPVEPEEPEKISQYAQGYQACFDDFVGALNILRGKIPYSVWVDMDKTIKELADAKAKSLSRVRGHQ